MGMTDRERILAVLDRKSPDRVPWIARLDLWYHARATERNLPARFRGMDVVGVGRVLRTGNPARGGRVFRVRYEGMEVRTETAPGVLRERFVTPHGEVTFGRILTTTVSGTTDQGLPLEHPLRRVEDYRVLEYIAEHTFYDPCYEEYLAYEAAVGDDGYPMVSCGDCPFHHFLLQLAGYNTAYFEMADHPREFEHLMLVMTEVERERLWPVVADSPARLILHGVHFDSQMTPPHLFRRHITPYYQEFSRLLHARGKSLTWHADDDSRHILAEVQEAGFDMAECFCTAPMVEVTLAEARAAWGTDVIIFGGVPSIVLEPTFPEAEFDAYMRELFRTIAPGDAFILGVADNVMPTSLIERVERISELVEQHGTYPIQPY
ncbi:MAG: uroporphyrinogen decarboxylase family protein [Candidatus Methylomirabilales bacterium]